MSLQNAAAQVFPIDSLIPGGGEQCMTHGFNAMPVTREKALVLFIPERNGSSDLRCCRRSAFAVQPERGAATKNCPRNIGRVSGERRGHAAVRSPASLELAEI